MEPQPAFDFDRIEHERRTCWQPILIHVPEMGPTAQSIKRPWLRPDDPLLGLRPTTRAIIQACASLGVPNIGGFHSAVLLAHRLALASAVDWTFLECQTPEGHVTTLVPLREIAAHVGLRVNAPFLTTELFAVRLFDLHVPVVIEEMRALLPESPI